MSSATLAELKQVGRDATALGTACLAIAERIDARVDTGAALASLARELRATLEAATAGAKQKATPLESAMDELAKRRKTA